MNDASVILLGAFALFVSIVAVTQAFRISELNQELERVSDTNKFLREMAVLIERRHAAQMSEFVNRDGTPLEVTP